LQQPGPGWNIIRAFLKENSYMAIKKLKKIEPVALTVTAAADLAKVADKALIALSQVLSHDLAPSSLASLYPSITKWYSALESMKNNTRDRLLKAVRETGTVKSEKGSMAARIGDFMVEARVQKTGFDDRKVEHLLRSKGASLDAGMDATLSYKASPSKLANMVGAELISEDELKTCELEIKYALQQPKPIQEE
jgi:hypothetical protein